MISKHTSRLITLCIPFCIISACSTPSHVKGHVPSRFEYKYADLHKAIAIDELGNVFNAWGKDSREDAINGALKKCGDQAGVTCKIVDVDGSDVSNYAYANNDDRFLSLKTEHNSSWFNPSTRYSCQHLSKDMAYSLLNSGHGYLDRDNDGHPCEWGKYSGRRKYQPSPKKYKSNCHWVNGYTKKDGTRVRGHRRCR